MNKKIQIIVSIIILFAMLGTHISYAISGSNNNSSFFSVSADKIQKKETLKISFDLSKIEYDNYKIVLNSNIDNSKIQTDDNITLKEEASAIVIEIDKTKMNLSNIEMSYFVPEETEINTKIQISAKVVIEEEQEIQDDEGNTTLTKQEKAILEESKTITIIEQSENKDNQKTSDENQNHEVDTDKEQNNNKEEDKNQNINTEKNKDSNNKQENKNLENTSKPSDSKNNNSMTNTKSSNKANNSNISTTSKNTNSSLMQTNKNIETATYNGSNNNYLKSLKIKGIELNTSFNKENTTYFIKVTNTSNLKITATAEDSLAKVAVVGNDNLKQGTNKILISVTAENGDIRYYRIFLNCEISNE